MRSIRTFLILSLISSIGIVILLAIVISYQRVTHETEELYDAEIAQISRVLEAVLSIELEFSGGTIPEIIPAEQTLILPPEIHAEGEYDSSGHKYEKKLAFQVWNRKGVPLLGSDASGSVMTFTAEEGFLTENINQQAWRTFTLYSEKLAIWIKVGQLVEIRDEVTEEVATVYSTVPLIMLPIIIILITLIVRRGLAPLESISREISARSTENLTPLKMSSIPAELRQVVDSVNHLLISLDRALERQKRFTSNAAHELRTPLAAIKVHAQNIYPEDERLKRVQSHIIQGIDKLTNLFNQLITLSRTETNHYASQQSEVAWEGLVASLKDNALNQMLSTKAIQLHVDFSAAPVVRSNPDALAIILRNLMDNALKYTPEGGQVWVRSLQSETDVVLELEDNGPGLSDNQRQLAFERFYRASNQTIEGCGLGLSIVYQLCEQFGYQVQLAAAKPDGTGLKVTIGGLQRAL
ncbi:ATP-binding protein [uncultured Neptuniibacter sp.]|uniref:ATP-binding protein n=1 Tax=uncultured Neptuniibacter sp. TaxID=502143 RepID=UPI0026252398|nr:ATP-binding protein [uncultured Neptuniibacter sp.]